MTAVPGPGQLAALRPTADQLAAMRPTRGEIVHSVRCAAYVNGCQGYLEWRDDEPQFGRRAVAWLRANGWREDLGDWVCGAHPLTITYGISADDLDEIAAAVAHAFGEEMRPRTVVRAVLREVARRRLLAQTLVAPARTAVKAVDALRDADHGLGDIPRAALRQAYLTAYQAVDELRDVLDQLTAQEAHRG